jgi:hypothetical protein
MKLRVIARHISRTNLSNAATPISSRKDTLNPCHNMQPRTRAHPRAARWAGWAAVLGISVACLPVDALAGAWLQKRDSYYFKVSASYLSSTKELNFDGDEVDILSGDTLLTDTSYRDAGVSLYLEYGVTDHLTFVGTLPFKVLRSRRTEVLSVAGIERPVEAVNGGLSDLSLGLRYPLRTGPLPVSVQGAVKLPLGYDNRPENGGPPLGSGRVDLEGLLLVGLSLYPFPGYMTGGAGYRVKTGNLDDEVIFSVEAGASWRRFMGRVGLDGLYSTSNPPNLAASGGGPVSSAVAVTNQDILKLTPGLSFSFSEEVSFVAEAFHILSGKNTVTGTTYSLGVVYRQ